MSGQPIKQRRGFAGMTPARRLRISSLGGKTAHRKGTAYEWTSVEARAAGEKGRAVRKERYRALQAERELVKKIEGEGE